MGSRLDRRAYPRLTCCVPKATRMGAVASGQTGGCQVCSAHAHTPHTPTHTHHTPHCPRIVSPKMHPGHWARCHQRSLKVSWKESHGGSGHLHGRILGRTRAPASSTHAACLHLTMVPLARGLSSGLHTRVSWGHSVTLLPGMQAHAYMYTHVHTHIHIHTHSLFPM